MRISSRTPKSFPTPRARESTSRHAHDALDDARATEALCDSKDPDIGDASNTLLVSIASFWEITIKIGTGKIVIPGPDIDSILQNLGAFRIQVRPLRARHLRALQALPSHHKDPFDRILIAQAQTEQVPLLTVDKKIRQYQVDAIW